MNPDPPKKQIVIIVEGGLIQWIHANLPPDHEIIVLDFDTEGADEDEVKKSPWPIQYMDNECFISRPQIQDALPFQEIPKPADDDDDESEEVYGCPICALETPMSEGFPPSCPNCHDSMDPNNWESNKKEETEIDS